MEEENKKGKSRKPLVVIIIILLIAVLGLGSYIFLNKDVLINKNCTNESKNNTTTKNETSKDNKDTKDTNDDSQSNVVSSIIFDGSKSLNSSGQNYTLSCQGNAGIWVSVDSTQKVLTFSFTPSRVVEFYSLSWTSDRNDVSTSTINFEKKIVDVYFGEMGQSSSGDTLFILLEDGTVEYIPIVHMFNNAQDGPISYGKINGINDVVKFSLANTSNGVTTLAIKADGSFYDLWYSLKDSGNY